MKINDLLHVLCMYKMRKGIAHGVCPLANLISNYACIVEATCKEGCRRFEEQAVYDLFERLVL